MVPALAGVHALVRRQLEPVRKPELAHGALKGSFSRVCHVMRRQMRPSRERPAALQTLVWPRAVVHRTNVLLKVRVMLVPLVAPLTLVRTMIVVGLDVFRQLPDVGKGFGAAWA